MKKLNTNQVTLLKSVRRQNDEHKSGPRVSYTVGGDSLVKRGFLEKKGTFRYRTYRVTQAGRDYLNTLEKE